MAWFNEKWIDGWTVNLVLFSMILLQIAGVAVCFMVNTLISRRGFSLKHSEEIDLLLPFTSIVFMFYPLIISLPEASYKLNNYSLSELSPEPDSPIDDEELFPYAFLISLLAITGSICLDRFFMESQALDDEGEKGPLLKRKTALQFLLTLSVSLQNVVNYYFICVEERQSQMVKEIFLFLLFSSLINFSHSYLLAQAGVDETMAVNLSLFMNSGIAMGFLLSLAIEPDMALLILPCVCAGLQIYCAIFVCFPAIFTNGQKPGEDKSRYCSIVIAFLLTVIYYPICYLLRI